MAAGNSPQSFDYVRVANVSEIKQGEMKQFEMEGGRVVVIANIGGKFYAIGGICTHEEWALAEGTLEGHRIICPGHGAEWDLTTGTATFDEELPPEPLFGVKIEDGLVYVTREPVKNG